MTSVSLKISTPSVEKQEQSQLCQLPLETIVRVLVHSKIRDIVVLGSTCKHFREISKDNHLWATLCVRDFGPNISNWTRSILIITGDTFMAYKAEHSVRTCEYKTQQIQPALDALKKVMAIKL
jgi:hypothetical protein